MIGPVVRAARWLWAVEVYGFRIMWADARAAAIAVGYWIRPYDMLADARRWRWQPRERCQWSRGGYIPPTTPTVNATGEDVVVFRVSPPTEVVSRELADRLGIAAAWDAEERRRKGGTS